MAAWLKQSTAVTIRLGPFVDATDGVTEETGLGAMGVEISKNHGAFGARNSATATAHDAEGWYSCELDATDTGTLGPLIVKAHAAATHLPVWREFMVMPANEYDSLVSGTDALDVEVASMAAGTITATAVADGAIDAGAIATGAITAAKFAAGAIDATAIADAAIDAATFAAGAIDAAALAADAGTEIGTAVWASATRVLTANTNLNDPTAAAIADAVWDEDATAHQTGGTFGQAIGDPGADTNTIFKAVVTDATGATVGADVVAVKAETASILTDTAEIGTAGAGLTNINLPDQTMNITGDITGNLSGSVGSVTGAVGSVTGAVGSVTGAVGSIGTGGIAAASFASGAVNAAALATDAVNEIADGILTRQMTEAYAADGVAPTLAQALFQTMQGVTEFSISGTTLTVKKIDGSTTAMTFTLDSASAPTSRTRAT